MVSYSKLESAGLARQIASDRDLPARPLHEKDIQNALCAIDSSTRAVEAQISTLQSQCDALRNFQRMEGQVQGTGGAIAYKDHEERLRIKQNQDLAVFW